MSRLRKIWIQEEMWKNNVKLRREFYNYIENSYKYKKDFLVYAYIVGLFEGDGYFSITKKGIYLLYEVGIELSIKDVQLTYKIKSLLGVGEISFRNRGEIEMVSLRIRNKNHLKEFL